jgi:hypothetical protein
MLGPTAIAKRFFKKRSERKNLNEGTLYKTRLLSKVAYHGSSKDGGFPCARVALPTGEM